MDTLLDYENRSDRAMQIFDAKRRIRQQIESRSSTGTRQAAAFHDDTSKPLAESLVDLGDVAVKTELWPGEYRIYTGYVDAQGNFVATSYRVRAIDRPITPSPADVDSPEQG